MAMYGENPSSYEDIMAWATDPGQVEGWLSRNKYAKSIMGFGLGDWDVDACKFSSTGRNLKRLRHSVGYRSDMGYGVGRLSPEQQGAVAEAIETTLTNLYSSRDAGKKSETLLGKIQAKSDMMEQLIETRRAKREEELSHNRGLY